MKDREYLKSLIDKLCERIPDKDICGKLCADLLDIHEECLWYVNFISNLKESKLTGDDLFKITMDFEIKLIGHMKWHLDSMSEYFPDVLEAFSGTETDDS